MPVRPRRPFVLRAVAAGLVAGVLLAACSSSSTNRSASGSDPDPSVTTTVVGAPSSTTSLAPDASTSSSTSSTSSTAASSTSTSSTSTTVSTPTTSTTVAAPALPATVVYPCASSVTIGPLEMRTGADGGCLERSGLEWVSRGVVFVGGIEFRPLDAASEVRFDPFNAQVYATGYRAFASVLGAPLLLESGTIDWSFQYSPSQNGPVGSSMPVESDTVDLGTVARLPGLSGVRSFPKQPVTGFADYTVVTDDSVQQLAGRFPSLATKDVVFPLDAIGLRAIPAYTISVPSDAVQKLFGLDVSGSFSIQPVSRSGSLGVAIGTSLDLPSYLSGYSGKFAAFFPVNGPMQIDELLVDIAMIDLGAVRFKDVYLTYANATDSWSGRISVLLGAGPDAIGLDGRLAIVGGRLQAVGVAVSGLPVNIGGGASINRLGGTLTIEPLGIRADGQLGFGPYVPNVGNIAVADGEIVIDQQEISLTGFLTLGSARIGDRSLKGLRVADARVAYYWNGLFSISGTGQFFLDPAETWGIKGGMRGGATADVVSLGGDVTVRLGPFVTLGGTAAVSSRGWIACGSVKGLWFNDVRLGISYDWGAEAASVRGSSCNSEEYQLPLVPRDYVSTPGRNASSGEDAGDTTQTVDVRAGQQMVTFSIDGSGDAATISGPDGTTIVVTGREQSAQSDPVDPRWIVAHQPGASATYVFVARPAAGTWTVSTAGPTAPVVTANVVSERSVPRDAPTEVVGPTSEPEPLSTHMAVVIASGSGSGAPWLVVVLVLSGLVLILAMTIVVTRRRTD